MSDNGSDKPPADPAVGSTGGSAERGSRKSSRSSHKSSDSGKKRRRSSSTSAKKKGAADDGTGSRRSHSRSASDKSKTSRKSSRSHKSSRSRKSRQSEGEDKLPPLTVGEAESPGDAAAAIKAKVEVLGEQAELAAIKIQAAFRGYMVRKGMVEAKEDDEAAFTPDQSHLARSQSKLELRDQVIDGAKAVAENVTTMAVHTTLDLADKFGAEAEAAAVKIQSAFRGYMVRKGLAKPVIVDTMEEDLEELNDQVREKMDAVAQDTKQKEREALRRALPQPTDEERVAAAATLFDDASPADMQILKDVQGRFVGRNWLLKEIEHWRRNAPKSEKGLLLTAPSGWGKTSIVGHMVRHAAERRIVAFHFCREDYVESLHAERFVRMLASTLARALPRYASILQDEDVWAALRKSSCARNPVTAFEYGIAKPLRSLSKPTKGDAPYLIMVDGLDEAVTKSAHPGEPGIVELLAQMTARLPRWIKVVAFSRPGVKVVQKAIAPHYRVMELSELDKRNVRDVTAFVENEIELQEGERKTGLFGFLASLTTRNKVSEEARAALEYKAKTDRNMAILELCMYMLFGGHMTPEEIRNIPAGMSSLYLALMHRIFSFGKFHHERCVIATLIAAYEPLTKAHIFSASHIAEAEFTRIWPLLEPFLRVTEDGKAYSIAHKSFPDFVSAAKNRNSGFVVTHMQGHLQLYEEGATAFNKGVDKVSGYYVRHLAGHMYEAKKFGFMLRMLGSMPWLRRKLKLTDSTALWKDFEYYPRSIASKSAADVVIVQRVLQAASESLETDPTQLNAQLFGRLAYEQKIGPWAKQLMQETRGALPYHWLAGVSVWFNFAHRAIPRAGLREQSVASIAISPTGKNVAVGMTNTSVMLHNTLSAMPVRSIDREHVGPVTGVAFFDGGALLVTVGWDANLKIVDPITKQARHHYRYHEGFINDLAVDGKFAITGSDDRTAYVIDLDNGALTKLAGHGGFVRAVALSNGHAVTGCWDKLVRVFNMRGALQHTFEGHTEPVACLAMHGNLVASGSFDRSIRLWDAARKKHHRTWYLPTIPHGVVFSPDGQFLISVEDGGTVGVRDIRGEGNALVTTFSGEAPMTAVDCVDVPGLGGTVIVAGDVFGHVYYFVHMLPGRALPDSTPWVPDYEVLECQRCNVVFTMFNRRHHCRNCGKVFCGDCSENNSTIPFQGYAQPVRVCIPCNHVLTGPHASKVDEDTSQSAASPTAADLA